MYGHVNNFSDSHVVALHKVDRKPDVHQVVVVADTAELIQL